MVQREFLRYYNLYNNQIQLGNDDTAKPIYELVAMLMGKVGNPYLVRRFVLFASTNELLDLLIIMEMYPR